MLTEVGFSDGSFGDCNPARCDNPPECGIPVCRGYLNGANMCGEKRCKEGTQGHDQGCKGKYSEPKYCSCYLRENCRGKAGVQPSPKCLTDDSHCAKPDIAKFSFVDDQLRTFNMKLPGARIGEVRTHQFPISLAMAVPQLARNTFDPREPTLQACNPLGWLVTLRTGSSPILDGDMTHGVLIMKRTVCMNSACKQRKRGVSTAKVQHNCPQRCYAYKEGKCYKFTGTGSVAVKKVVVRSVPRT